MFPVWLVVCIALASPFVVAVFRVLLRLRHESDHLDVLGSFEEDKQRNGEIKPSTVVAADVSAGGNNGGTAREQIEPQPYESLAPGRGDLIKLYGWQSASDVEHFEQKIFEIGSGLTKLPFTHPRDNLTVVFLGRNVDAPGLVFRNPFLEAAQRSNVGKYTQSIRNAVASSVIRDSRNLRVYVPRSVLCSWNGIPGVLQEYVLSASTSRATHRDEPGRAAALPGFGLSAGSGSRLYASEEAVRDFCFLGLVLRDTDMHEGNYCVDVRRKVALFDLGCALATSPLQPDDRACLVNFEVLSRAGAALDCAFQERHVECLRAFGSQIEDAIEVWKHFSYPQSLLQKSRRTYKGERSTSGRNHSDKDKDYVSSTAQSGLVESIIPVQPSPETDLSSPLCHPLSFLRVMKAHIAFISACVEFGRSMRFAAETMFNGQYDDLWWDVLENSGFARSDEATATSSSSDQASRYVLMPMTRKDFSKGMLAFEKRLTRLACDSPRNGNEGPRYAGDASKYAGETLRNVERASENVCQGPAGSDLAAQGSATADPANMQDDSPSSVSRYMSSRCVSTSDTPASQYMSPEPHSASIPRSKTTF